MDCRIWTTNNGLKTIDYTIQISNNHYLAQKY